MPLQDTDEVAQIAARVAAEWESDKPLTLAVLDRSVRLYLAVMEQVRLRGYQAVSLIDVDGVKKLLGFTPAAANMLWQTWAG